MLRRLRAEPVMDPAQNEAFGRGPNAADLGPNAPTVPLLLGLLRTQQARLDPARSRAQARRQLRRAGSQAKRPYCPR